jgi:DNA end-binding protein Ku
MGDGTLGMATMVFPDEIIDPSTLDELADTDDVEINERELAIAKQLVDSLSGEWDPDKYHDTYREEVLALVERKAQGEQIAVQPDADEEEAEVPDLMAALKASLDAVRAREDDGGAAKKPAPEKSAAAKKPAAKKPAAKKTPAKS